MENKESRIKRISKSVSDFYSSMYIIIIFMTITTIFGIIQITLFCLNILEINGVNISNTDKHLVTIAWITTLISLISCYTGLIGAVCNIRGSNSFLFWMTIQLTLLSIVSLLAGAMLASISSLYGLTLAYVRYFFWKYNLHEKLNISERTLFICAGIFLIILISIFLSVVTIELNNQTDISENYKFTFYFDAIGAALEMCAYTFMLFKVWWAFSFFFVSKFFFGTIYGFTGNIITMVQMIIFATTDISGMLSWSVLKK